MARLSKSEDYIMTMVYNRAKNNDFACILNDNDFIDGSPEKLKINSDLINITLHKLELDGYYELTVSEKKGNVVYVIKLSALGKAYARIKERERREYISRTVTTILFSLLGAIVGAIAGVLVRSVFVVPPVGSMQQLASIITSII